MSLINHNNNVPITTSGSYCPVTVGSPPSTVTATTGSPCQIIEQVGWLIVGNATAAGTINLQVKDPLDATFRTPTTAPTGFPITIAANGVYAGILAIMGHGFQFAVTLTAGGLTVCELIGKTTEYEE